MSRGATLRNVARTSALIILASCPLGLRSDLALLEQLYGKDQVLELYIKYGQRLSLSYSFRSSSDAPIQ